MTAAAPAAGSLLDMAHRGALPPLTLVLVRHGVTDMTETHALSGSSVDGPPLNSRGRIQAAHAADAVYRMGRDSWDRVAPVTRLVASPMTRTQDTAAALGRRLGLRVETDDRVREVHFGEWEGRTAADIAAEDAAGLLAWQRGAGRPPGGESIGDVGHRMWEFVTSAAAEHVEACADEARARTVAVATHAVAIKSAVGAVMRTDLEQWGQMWPAPASLTVLQFAVTPDDQIGERHLLGFAVPTH